MEVFLTRRNVNIGDGVVVMTGIHEVGEPETVACLVGRVEGYSSIKELYSCC